MELPIYKIEVATKLDELDRSIIKDELLFRLERLLGTWIEIFSESSDEEAESDLKYNLLHEDYFADIQKDYELINVFQEDEPESWNFQRVLIKSWANNKI
jgi:hypothetical protein